MLWPSFDWWDTSINAHTCTDMKYIIQSHSVGWLFSCIIFKSLLEYSCLQCCVIFCCIAKWISYTCVYIYISSLFFFLVFLPIEVTTEHWVEYPPLYSRFSLVIYFIHSSVYMSIPISQFLPPPLPSLVSMCLSRWSKAFEKRNRQESVEKTE